MLMAGIAEEMDHFAVLCETSMRAGSAWRRAPRWAVLAAAVFLIVRTDLAVVSRVSNMVRSERDQRAADRPVFSWIESHAQPDTVVLAWKDSVSYLYSGRPSSHGLFVAIRPQEDVAKPLASSFANLPKQYSQGMLLLLRSDFEDHQLAPIDGSSVPNLRLEYSSPSALIYGFPITR